MVVLLAGLAAQASTYYGFKIGGVPVNSDNCANVTGSTISGSVSYDPSTNTVTLTDVTIDRTGDYNRCIHNESNDGLIVNLQGTNNLSAADAAAVRLDSGVGMMIKVLSGTTNISSVDEEAIYVTSNSNYTLDIYVKGDGKLNIRSTNKAGIASTNTCILFLGGAMDIYGKKGAIDWKHQVVIDNTDGLTGITMRSTITTTNPVFKAKKLTLNNGNQIIQPSGAVWDSSQQTITLNGSPVCNQDILIGKNCALLINYANFPDYTLRNYLLGRYPKGYLTTTELANFTTLNVRNVGVSDLTGVKLLTNLVDLICPNNYLTSLDVSGLTNLKYLDCMNNPTLSSLNVSNCTALEDIFCGSTAISSINVSTCTSLSTLNCSNTRVTVLRVPSMPHLAYLNVSNCTQLQQLYCNENTQLVQITLTGCTALKSLQCSDSPVMSRLVGLTDCTALQNFYCYNCSLTSLSDVQSLPNLAILSCMNNYLTTLTLTNKTHLTDVYCQNNPNLTTLTVTNNPALVTFNCSNCTSLTNLNAYYNDLTTFIITGCTALKELRCHYNSNLASITGVGGCTALTYVDCEDCALTTLQLQNATNIATIYARNNQLPSFAISDKSSLKTLWVSNNPLTTLHCYSNALTSLSVTGCTSLANLSCYENASLSTIGGLTDLSNLTTLYAYSCNFSSLNLANKTKLTTLNCHGNKLTSLNLTGCTALTDLRCYTNSNLSTITGLADCKAITYLDCEDCSITELPGVNSMNNITTLLARNNNLTSLTITSKSKLTNLRVSGNTMLTSLKCYYNGLTTLNVANCSSMTYLDCCGNKLTSLTVSGCTALNHLEIYRNQISGSNMTALVNSLPARSMTNSGELLAIFNSSEGNSMTPAQITIARNKYWSPKKWNGGSWVDLTAVQPGDVDGDGTIGMDDLATLINYMLSNDASIIDPIGADVDTDGSVGMDDLAELINYLLTH